PRPVSESEVWTGPQLRDLRRAAGLRYTDLAERAGISSRLLAEIECGLLPLDADLQQRLANALGQALTTQQPQMPTS
ncbi:MAG: helix-turn-helix domain-containing protein, partial [Chloroflexales bacterium]|nr:helix-turn-helix domain-containing protein [Chloroflexales bacterium]